MARQNDRELDQGGRQRHGLQLSWLFPSDDPGIEEIHGLSGRSRTVRRVSSDSDSPDNQSNCDDRARGKRGSNPCRLPSTRAILFAERDQAIRTGGAGCGVIYSGIREGNPFGSTGEIPKERLIRMWARRSRFPGEYSSLMLLRNPLLKPVLSV
jgi:hypothetical protein